MYINYHSHQLKNNFILALRIKRVYEKLTIFKTYSFKIGIEENDDTNTVIHAFL